jgi:hypothetical protein
MDRKYRSCIYRGYRKRTVFGMILAGALQPWLQRLKLNLIKLFAML